MKVVVINGQNHKGSSYHMGSLLAESLTSKDNIKEFFLPHDLNHYCLGCYACLEDESRCPYWNEKEKIIKAMEEADVFIFTTPNYCMAPSGGMKSFIDFTFDYWMVHKPKEWMFYKKAVILSCSAGAGCKSVNNIIKKSLLGWGVSYILSFGLPVHARNWNEVPEAKKDTINKKLSKIAKKIKSKKRVRVSLRVKITFNFMRLLHIKGWDSSPSELVYWKKQGWIDKKRPWNKK